jgi:SAM-dependent methyltransferase
MNAKARQNMARAATVKECQPSLFPEVARNGNTTQTGYDPLPSIWDGTDAELLEKMLGFYPHKTPGRILDATVNRGRFWVGSSRPVTGMDIDPKHKPDIVGDHNNMPFADRSFDVIVYDPPHIPNQGKDKRKDFNKRFGLVVTASPEQGYNLSHLYPPFLSEAYRVLRKDGVLFCKIADYVHGHKFQWAHVEIITAASSIGFTACDCIVKIRKGPITDPRWKKAHHARRHHCYWLVFRKSKKCE